MQHKSIGELPIIKSAVFMSQLHSAISSTLLSHNSFVVKRLVLLSNCDTLLPSYVRLTIISPKIQLLTPQPLPAILYLKEMLSFSIKHSKVKLYVLLLTSPNTIYLTST